MNEHLLKEAEEIINNYIKGAVRKLTTALK